MALLEASGVRTGYGNVLIVDVEEFSVESGERATIIGPNGAGKSTLLKCLARLLPLWEGTLRFEGESIADDPPEKVYRNGLCYVPQDANVFPSLTVEENLKIGGWILDENREERIADVYDHFPVLEERSGQRVRNMSGGERQMVAIGMSLMVDPDLLMLDEPSAGLAPQLVEDMFRDIVRINEAGTTVLMVEQNARRALEASDRGIVLDNGSVEMQGDSGELLDSPRIAELYLGQE